MKKATITAGKQILDIITSGMYSNSMMVLREYVQNAADSIDNAISENMINHESARIDIEIDGESRKICITDNGSGVSSQNVSFILSSIGVSSKSNGNWRGFRGIGRLGGLGYCDQVIFETRSSKKEPVFVATWDAKTLRNECRNAMDRIDLIDAISKIVGSSSRHATLNDPPHFFRVTMTNIHKFHKDDLMNIEAIKEYLSQVSPVPYDAGSFSFSKEISSHLSALDGYRTYNIYLNGNRLFKPHKDLFSISGQTQDKIIGVQFFEIKGRKGDCIARGWFAQSSYRASLHQKEKMRGIRIRQGNIEVGDEFFLADHFSERRFSTWHTGEIHFNYNQRLNARRDGFEQSPDYECFLEQGYLLCKHLSNLCRHASRERSKEQDSKKFFSAAQESLDRAIFSGKSVRKEAIQKAKHIIESVGNRGASPPSHSRKLTQLRDQLKQLQENALMVSTLLDGRILRAIDQKDLVQQIANRILKEYQSHSSPTSLIRSIIAPYVRK
jgi:Histidine kinase-, DNA gyrase B-, and HSP90-like ATPase